MMIPARFPFRLSVLGSVAILLVGCTKTVLVPPRFDLRAYETIGMVEFSSNAEGNLEQFASQKFVQTLQTSQPGVRILELGSTERVLGAIQRDQLDHGAIQAIGEKYHVDAVVIGHIDVTSVKPKLALSSILSTMSVQADVEASLTARLLEAGNGATLWTRSSRGRETVAHVGVSKSGPVHFGASDPENAYGRLVHGLVYAVTRDFRATYEKL